MSAILTTRDIRKSYRMGPNLLEVLRGIDFSVEAGEFVAMVGASGSGKSTFLHILGALDTPDNGEVIFGGHNLARFGRGRLNEYRNRSVGFVFQFYHLLDELDVVENTILPAMAASSILSWPARRGPARQRATELLRRFGLGERLKHKPYELSGGERQRVSIARALMNQPTLLLADEPTGNLDSKTGNDILNVLEQLNREGQTVLMVTHDDRIARRAHRIVRLADGRMVTDRSQ
ncbi:MAG: ABC transporter ATP-binding protein [Phycisphaerae bacterium]|nr:ABC transporter ATP-binding protein [Phycisphaerae bacterium]